MLKQYLVNGKQYQFEEGEKPEGALEITDKSKDTHEDTTKDDTKPETRNKAGRVKEK